MAETTCPNCGKPNPDFLDACQFCQTPLKSESTLHIGEKPTKKNTGELESVLPEWLKDVRQQARESAEEDAAQALAQPKVQKNETPDLLAGLASQSEKAEEDEIPDWLASINPVKTAKPSTPPSPEPETDFFAQFNRSDSQPAPASEPAQGEEEIPAWMDRPADQPPAAEPKDELSAWFSQASASKPVEFESSAPAADETGWQSNFDSSGKPEQEPASKEPEDLGWLHDLEASSKNTGELPTPGQDRGWLANFEAASGPSQPSDAAQTASSRPEDLSWLDNLGRTSEPSQSFDASQNQPGLVQPFGVPEEKPSDSGSDLSWLDNLGRLSEPSRPSPARVPGVSADQDFDTASPPLGAGVSPPAQEKPAAEEPFSFEENLSWLSSLGATSEPLAAPPFSESTSEAPSEASPPIEEEGQSPVRPFSVPTTAELRKDTSESMPDWLKSATEEPAIPPPGALSMDWFRQADRPADKVPPPPSDKPFGSAQDRPEPVPFESSPIPSAGGTGPLSNQDVDDLFSMEMPDWLARPESGKGEPAPQQTQEADESLAPVELPSWVQAMRPVEALISETAPNVEDQVTEKEGPLAGLMGVIPVAPIGSSRRPKALSFMIQATDEQQKSAALLEQILAGETNPRPLITSSSLLSQRVLRWVLTGLFFLVLGAVLALNSRAMPVSAALPETVNNITNAMITIPDGSKVLVVIDYEPSHVGEMEAVGGPLLDQLVLARFPVLSFLSTSPNGSALVERLMTDTRINQPAPDGLAYQAGMQYFNLGYLPGGAAGVLGFLEAPGDIIPASGVQSFSEYSAVLVLTDQAESGRIWVEQLQGLRQTDPLFPALTNQPLLMAASAQASPLLQPYVSSGQVTGMISGLSEAARYEYVNGSRPGIARSYWDTFGIGLMMSIALIVLGGLWSLFTGIRAQRAGAEQG